MTPELREYESQILHADERVAGDRDGDLPPGLRAGRRSRARRSSPAPQAVGRARRRLRARRAPRALRLRPPGARRRRRDRDPRRAPPGGRAVAVGGRLRAQRRARSSPSDAQIIVLTGPNMAGKSTYLRQVALHRADGAVRQLRAGASARIGVVDRIFTRVGAGDDLARGQSTFMVEMSETAHILHNATARSLVDPRRDRPRHEHLRRRLDRVGGRRAPARPAAAAAKTLFATHYHELVDLARHLPRVRNYNVAVAEEHGRIVFLRRIVPGGADRSYGIHVAELAGLPTRRRPASARSAAGPRAQRQRPSRQRPRTEERCGCAADAAVRAGRARRRAACGARQRSMSMRSHRSKP